MKLGVEKINFKIPYCRTVFNFSCKTSGFCGAGCFFGGTFLSIFCHFFMQNFSFLRGWEVFLSKKKTLFFRKKFQVLRGWMLFLTIFKFHFLYKNKFRFLLDNLRGTSFLKSMGDLLLLLWGFRHCESGSKQRRRKEQENCCQS